MCVCMNIRTFVQAWKIDWFYCKNVVYILANFARFLPLLLLLLLVQLSLSPCIVGFANWFYSQFVLLEILLVLVQRFLICQSTLPIYLYLYTHTHTFVHTNRHRQIWIFACWAHCSLCLCVSLYIHMYVCVCASVCKCVNVFVWHMLVFSLIYLCHRLMWHEKELCLFATLLK